MNPPFPQPLRKYGASNRALNGRVFRHVDGYAVRTADLKTIPHDLVQVGSAPAGQSFNGVLGVNETVRIFTGAPVPEGSDAIVIQENTKVQDEKVIVTVRPRVGQYIRRAGLDYREFADVAVFSDLNRCLDALGLPRVFAFSTRGRKTYASVKYGEGDAFLFGPETRGLPANILDSFLPGRRLRLPMQDGSRSLNLSNAAAVVIYEAWRQNQFDGGA